MEPKGGRRRSDKGRSRERPAPPPAGRGPGKPRADEKARGWPSKGARQVALKVALLSLKRNVPADDALDEMLASGELPPRERRLAEEIAFGSIRHRSSLDLVIAAVADRPLVQMDLAMLEALRQAVYQTFFLSRIPDHAAVDEAVRLARSFVGESAAGYANAVLRSALKLRAGRGHGEPAANERRAALAFRGGEFVRLAQSLLPDPESDSPGWMAAYYSYPRWLVDQFIARWGRAGAERVLAWGNEVPPLTVRVNPLRADVGDLASREPAELCAPTGTFGGCAAAARGELPGSYRIRPELPLDEIRGFKLGLFTAQDETQQLAARWLAPRAGEEVLDLCAAPGGKTTALAELSGDKAKILACDIDALRLQRVTISAGRLGLKSIATRLLTAPPLPADLAGRFDKVLADAPCSNTGSMNRRVEARWRARPDAVAELAKTQRGILLSAVEAAKPGGGQVLYSTCSLLEAENEAVVRAILDGRADLELVREETVLPRATVRDGGYLALIRRK